MRKELPAAVEAIMPPYDDSLPPEYYLELVNRTHTTLVEAMKENLTFRQVSNFVDAQYLFHRRNIKTMSDPIEAEKYWTEEERTFENYELLRKTVDEWELAAMGLRAKPVQIKPTLDLLASMTAEEMDEHGEAQGWDLAYDFLGSDETMFEDAMEACESHIGAYGQAIRVLLDYKKLQEMFV